MNLYRIDNLINAYLDARSVIVDSGYATEMDWQENVSFDKLDESTFLREISWVILSAGMKETVIRKKFIELTSVFCNWRSSEEILRNYKARLNKALRIFNHLQKISAIISVAKKVKKEGFGEIKRRIEKDKIEFDYIGPVTAYHLAKNIGLNVAKPDRHLMRITQALKFENTTDLCNTISHFTGDKVSVVDLVLWRYATINKNYLNDFNSLVAT